MGWFEESAGRDSTALGGGSNIQREVVGSWRVGEVVGPGSKLLKNRFNSLAHPRSMVAVAPPLSLRHLDKHLIHVSPELSDKIHVKQS